MIESKLRDAFREWAQWGKDYAVGIIQDELLSGQMVGVRTGYLRRMVGDTAYVFPNREGFVISTGTVLWPHGAFYGQILHVGTTRHLVQPKQAKALQFFSSGQDLSRSGFQSATYVKSAIIPALAPRPFLDAAEPLVKPGLQAKIAQVSQKSIDVSFEDKQIEIVL